MMQWQWWQDKKHRKKFWSLFQLIVCCLIAFPLEIVDIFFMFSHPNHYEPLTTVNQTNLFHAYVGQIIFQWIAFILVTFVIFYGGWKYFKNAFNETFKWKRWGMSTLISLSVVVSYGFSFYPLIQDTIWLAQLHSGILAATSSFPKTGMLMSFFPTAAIVITIATIGGYITTSLKLRANDDLSALSALQVAEAYRKNGASIEKVATKQLQIGDVVVVYKNTLIPMDGKLLSPTTLVNEAMVTGESRPVLKKQGDLLIGSTTNLGETCEIEITTSSKDSVIAGIIKNVKRIQAQKPKYQKIADKISFWFIPIVLTVSIITFFLHAFVPDFNEALHNYTAAVNNYKPLPTAIRYISAVYAAVAILVVACPCSLGLAVPLALVISSSRSAKNGIMLTKAEAYEKIQKLDYIAFDKTGTLTRGEFEVRDYFATTEQLDLLFQLESKSLHPLAQSFQKFYSAKFGSVSTVTPMDIQELPGVGMVGTTPDGTAYRATSFQFIQTQQFTFDPEITAFLQKYQQTNQLVSLVCLTKNTELVAVVVLFDDLNENAFDTVQVLQHNGIQVCLISGDNNLTTKNIAAQLGVSEYYAEVNPEQKAEIIAKLKQGGKTIAFVGDGINDIVAMKQADLSISFNKDNAVANAITDVNILNRNVFSVFKALKIIQGTRKNILWNIFWAFLYNSILIPLTVMGYVPPYIAAFAMMCSEIVIVTTTIVFKKIKWRIIPRKLFQELNNPRLDEKI